MNYASNLTPAEKSAALHVMDRHRDIWRLVHHEVGHMLVSGNEAQAMTVAAKICAGIGAKLQGLSSSETVKSLNTAI